MDKTTRRKVQNIHHALSAAVSSINLAKRLLNELERGGGSSPRELPGEFGVFDGHFMVTEEGEKYAVPENYASKSKLVYGDKLKRIVQDGEELFKQVERVKRQEIEGILAKKDGKWHVIDSHGSYEVLPAAVKYFGAKEGDEVEAIIPQGDPHVPFAALEGLVEKEEKPAKDKGGEDRKNLKVVKEAKKAGKKTTAEEKKAVKPAAKKMAEKEEEKEEEEEVAVEEELR